jgi:hypothetical protein
MMEAADPVAVAVEPPADVVVASPAAVMQPAS